MVRQLPFLNLHRKHETMKTDIYAEITGKIVQQLEQGVRPWSAPWKANGNAGGLPPLPIRSCGKAYSGINLLLLWGAMQEQGFGQRRFMTFKQAQALGACVRKGSKGTRVVYASTFTKDVENTKGETEEKDIPFLKSYTVFNIEQIEGLKPELFETFDRTEETGPQRIEAAEAFLNSVGADIRYGGHKAFFSPSHDFVQMPPLCLFNDAESFYATAAHELVHWTGGKARLDRTFGKRFGDSAYAFEELVAEMGAAFVCSALGLAAEPREDHAAYLAHWLKVLKADKRAIFTAASAASKAVELLHKLAAEPKPEPLPVSAPVAVVQPVPVPVPALRKPKEGGLLGFLARYGLRDDGGELRALDAELWHRDRPFRRRLVREDGLSLAHAAELAFDMGYLPDAKRPSWDGRETMEPVDGQTLIDAVARELRGESDHYHAMEDFESFAA